MKGLKGIIHERFGVFCFPTVEGGMVVFSPSCVADGGVVCKY